MKYCNIQDIENYINFKSDAPNHVTCAWFYVYVLLTERFFFKCLIVVKRNIIISYLPFERK